MSVPSVSITIPCRNEIKYISKCLDSIINSTYPKDKVAVFVCDGCSDDGTIELVEKYATIHSFIHILPNFQKTTPFALNLGLKAQDSDIKIILGAHAEIYPDFISNCISTFNISNEIGCVGGVIENINEDERTQAISLAMSSRFGVGNTYFRLGNFEGYTDTVAFGAYKKEVFEKIGFFDEELIRNQDDEFNYRLIKHGFKIYLNPSIKSKYFVRSSFLKLFRQYYQYGYWKVYVNTKHRTITTLRQLIPAIFVSFMFFGGFSIIFFPILTPFYISIILLYFITSLSFAIALSKKIKTVLGLVFSFFVLHISYGLGYLEGIIHFFVMKKKPKKSSTKLTR